MRKRNIKRILKSPVKKEILEFLMTENGAFYGDLVMKMTENQLTILEHLIELKRLGYIYKEERGGRFRINDDYFVKRIDSKGKVFKNEEGGEWTIIDEINAFSAAMRSRENKIDNEISINKLVTREQKIGKNKEKK
jgi:DNA-binding transcriptional ArsR family regulator